MEKYNLPKNEKKFANVIDLYYDTETGQVKSKIGLGCNRNSIVTIGMFTLWVMELERTKDGLFHEYYMINKNGIKVPLNAETNSWFGGLR